jgi:hypothetical protein
MSDASLRERITRVPLAARVVIGVVVALVGLSLGARLLDRSVGGGEPTGAPASSFATTPSGLAAYSELLRRYDHPVTRQRGDLVDASLDPASTLMILDPQFLDDADAGEALQFVVNGGRLVIGGTDPDRYLHQLRDHPPTWTQRGSSTLTTTRQPFAGIGRVETAGGGTWDDSGSSIAVVGREGDALVTREHVGRGEMFFVADVSPLTNELLAQADNAAFGLTLAREGQPVVFAEGVHGYGATRGFAAIPQRWKFAFAGIGLAALALLWARGRRLGPPEDAERALPPPRRAYVDALAVMLERTHDRQDAVAPVRAVVRARIATRAGLPPDARPDDVDRAARTLGFDDDERRVLLRGPESDGDVVVAGRALARVERWEGRAEGGAMSAHGNWRNE